jgi:hypothetical protein
MAYWHKKHDPDVNIQSRVILLIVLKYALPPRMEGGANAIKLSTFGAATSVADIRLKSHPLAALLFLSS